MKDDISYKRDELFPIRGLIRFFRRHHFFESNLEQLNSDKHEIIQEEDKLGFGASLLFIYNCEVLTGAGMIGYAAWQGLELLLK